MTMKLFLKLYCGMIIAALSSACDLGKERATPAQKRNSDDSALISGIDQFLNEIDRSVRRNDSVAFASLCRFPLQVKKSLDHEGIASISENHLISSFAVFIEEYRGEQTNEYRIDGKTGAMIVKEIDDTNRRSILAAIAAIRLKGISDADELDVGPLILKKINGTWRIVRIYSDLF